MAIYQHRQYGGENYEANSSVYAATKFAVIGFSDALRLELADKGVCVTTVNPGPIETSFWSSWSLWSLSWEC